MDVVKLARIFVKYIVGSNHIAPLNLYCRILNIHLIIDDFLILKMEIAFKSG